MMNDITAEMRDLSATILRVRFHSLEQERICCQRLLELAKKHGFPYGIAFANIYLGDYYLAKNDGLLCGQHLMNALEICQQESFRELYMRVCHFLGIYYSLRCDEQTGLKYSFECLSLAQEFKDYRLESLVYNNIADAFRRKGGYAEAKHYYLLAYQKLSDGSLQSMERNLLLIFSNLSELFRFSGEFAEAAQYLHMCEQLEMAEGDQALQRLIVQSGFCCCYAKAGQRALALTLAEQLLTTTVEQVEDTYLVTEVLFSVCDAMIELLEETCAERCLNLLSDLCTHHEIDSMQRMMKLRVRCSETFSSQEKLFYAYREYYQVQQQIDATENGVGVSGMNAKIHLQEAMKQQESTLLENKRLESAAHQDELTGIYNRRYFNKLISKTRHSSEVRRAGFIMIDVDYFKEYNDTYGHAMGDQVLCAVATTLKKYAGEDIWASRYGGDEFACFCLNREDKEIEAYLKQVQQEIQVMNIPHRTAKPSGRITLSVGYSSTAGGGPLQLGALIEAADQALYRSKEKGRNRWSVRQIGEKSGTLS